MRFALSGDAPKASSFCPVRSFEVGWWGEGVFYTEKTDSRLFKYAEKYDETSWIHGRYYYAWHPNRYWGTTELPKGFNVSFHPITPGARSIPNTSMNPIQREVVAPSAQLNGVLARYVHRYSSKPATP